MDFSQADMKILAPQLRKPEGDYGKEVGKVMAENNGAITAFTLDCLDVQPRDHVLEIGFGPGEGIAQAAQLAPDGFIAGIDYSQTMLTMAEQRNHRALMEEQVELTLGDARALPYGEESFQKLFAVNVFHFWPEPSHELAECLRVLQPGGRIAFSMAFPSSWRPGMRESGVFIAREPEDVMKHLRDAGFKNTESHTIEKNAWKGFAVVGEKYPS